MASAYRVYYRCPICLSVGVVDVHQYAVGPAPLCDLCEKPMQFMGQVLGQRLVRKELLTPCDSRCTNAPGPNCDCQCGGENHGTQRLVEVYRDVSGVPKIRPPDAAAAKRREEYLAAKKEANERIKELFGEEAIAKFKAREFIPGQKYWDMRAVQDEYHHATGLKSHQGRLKALQKVAAARLSK